MPTQITAIVIFAVGFASALLLVALIKAFKKRDRESEIEFLQFERDHREQLRDSKIHRDRVARRSIFSALFFLGFVLMYTVMTPTTGFHDLAINTENPSLTLMLLSSYLFAMEAKVLMWVIFTAYVFVLWRRYKNLNSYQKYLNKIDEKMVKVRKRLEGKK